MDDVPDDFDLPPPPDSPSLVSRDSTGAPLPTPPPTPPRANSYIDNTGFPEIPRTPSPPPPPPSAPSKTNFASQSASPAPAPPPPPPIPSGGPLPPPPPPGPSPAGPPPRGNDFANQLQGVTLRPTEPIAKKIDSRGALLAQIQEGKKLRRVSTVSKKPKRPEDLNTVEDVLKHIFDERFAATNYSDFEEEDDDGESEW